MVKVKSNFKKGAASFYIVAFSTLILVVLATSFAMIIASEVTRTANDDLSQSAYDSALAGTEDAKIAFSNYRRCAEAGETASKPSSGGSITCKDIMYWMQNPDCYMVGHILGKIPKGVNYEDDNKSDNRENREVMVGSKIKGNDVTNQAYTCVIINRDLPDYTGTLNRENTMRTFRIMIGSEDDLTNTIEKLKITWRARETDTTNFATLSDGRVIFPIYSLNNLLRPPILEVKLIQTDTDFTMQQFDEAYGVSTNRATLYLVPQGTGEKTRIEKSEVAKTNDRTATDKPFLINCSGRDCTAEIILPAPIGTDGKVVRNNNTFVVSLSLPYQKPDTDFIVEACEKENGECSSTGGKAKIYNTQISIDSTGRANDLYRRVETRLETEDTAFGSGYPRYALQILGGGEIKKKMKVEYEKRPGDDTKYGIPPCVGGQCFYF